jgi:hypothetical protein
MPESFASRTQGVGKKKILLLETPTHATADGNLMMIH